MARRKPTKPARLLPTSKSERSRRWHTRQGEELLSAINSNVTRLLTRKRRANYARWRELLLDEASSRTEHEGIGLALGKRARHNIVRNAVESMVADHAADLARPMIVPIGGDHKLTRKVKALQRAIDGDWQRLDADAMREAQIHDACTYGEGHIRVYPSFARAAWRRVRPWCLLTDAREDAVGMPMTRYELSAIDVDVLIETYATEDGKVDEDVASEIEDSDRATGKFLEGSVDDDDELVFVIEAWRLPARPGGNGRHVVCTSRAVLLDEPWTADFFPHSTLLYSRDPESVVTGRGLPERMCGQQYEQNSTAEVISDNKRLIAGAKLLCGSMATIDEGQLTNDAGAVINVEGDVGQVQVLAHSGNAIDLIQNARIDRQEMLADQGINPMSTSGQMPDGVDSGKAQQVYRDNVKNRHAMLGRQCERATVQLARLHIHCWEQIVDSGEDVVVRAKGRTPSVLEEINYNEVRVSQESFDVQIFPVSRLSNDPSGRMREVQDMQQAQWISPMEARRLMDLPDLEESNDLSMAGQDLAIAYLDAAIEIDAEEYARGARIVPSRVCDREYLVQRGWQMHAVQMIPYVRDPAKADVVHADLAALRDCIAAAQTQLDQEAAQMQAAMQAQQAAAAPPPQPPPAAAPPPQPMGPIGVVQ